MNAVGDRVDRVFGEHVPRRFAVFLGHTVNVVAHCQSQIGQVQPTFVVHGVVQSTRLAVSQYALGQIQWKLVVPRGYRRVGCEYALATDGFQISKLQRRSPGCFALLAQQLQRQQCGVTFVHVEPFQRVVAERPQNPHAGDAQDETDGEPYEAARRSARRS